MPRIAHSAQDMISGMTPQLMPGSFVFASVKNAAKAGQLAPQAIATFQETEGMSLLLPVAEAEAAGFSTDQPMRQITLNVYSSLEGVGLTAAVASVLADAGIACNMVAAHHHDHAFVPARHADRAMALLQALQANGVD